MRQGFFVNVRPERQIAAEGPFYVERFGFPFREGRGVRPRPLDLDVDPACSVTSFNEDGIGELGCLESPLVQALDI